MSDNIIDKLRKLFALAEEGSGATDGEREAAAAQAAKLMAKYDIERGEVGEDDGAPRSRAGMKRWRTITRDELWIAILATSISNGLGDPVEVLRYRGRGTDAEVCLIGSDVKIEFVIRLAEYLIPQFKAECERALIERKKEQSRYRDGLEGALFGQPSAWTGADTRRFRLSFLKTASINIKARIKDAYQEVTDGASTALVLRSEQDDIDAYKEENDIKVRQSKTAISDRAGAAAGAGAARSADIRPNNKVEGGGRHRLGAGA